MQLKECQTIFDVILNFKIIKNKTISCRKTGKEQAC